MTLERHARMASIARTRDGRTTLPETDRPPAGPEGPPDVPIGFVVPDVDGAAFATVSCDRAGNAYSPSSSMPMSSCTSLGPNVVPLLNGTCFSARQQPPPASPFAAASVLRYSSSQNPNPLARNTSTLLRTVCSSAAVRSNRAGTIRGCLFSVVTRCKRSKL